MRTRIKICAMTRIEDALLAAELGADAIGLVFHPASPRFISIEQAAKIVAALPPFVTSVGVFVNASAEFIKQALTEASLDLLQFHGDESPEECGSYARPILKRCRCGRALISADC